MEVPVGAQRPQWSQLASSVRHLDATSARVVHQTCCALRHGGEQRRVGVKSFSHKGGGG